MTTLSRDQAVKILQQAAKDVEDYGQDCGDVAERCGADGGFGILAVMLRDHFTISPQEVYGE